MKLKMRGWLAAAAAICAKRARDGRSVVLAACVPDAGPGNFRGANELTEESRVARIYDGMHFRYATTAGAEAGQQVANWTMQQHFRRND